MAYIRTSNSMRLRPACDVSVVGGCKVLTPNASTKEPMDVRVG